MELRMSRKERDRLSEGLCEKVVAALTSAWCFFGTRWSTLRILWAMHRWRVAGVKTRECPSRREPTGPKNLTYAEGFIVPFTLKTYTWLERRKPSRRRRRSLAFLRAI
jgi:hypothetical protein